MTFSTHNFGNTHIRLLTDCYARPADLRNVPKITRLNIISLLKNPRIRKVLAVITAIAVILPLVLTLLPTPEAKAQGILSCGKGVIGKVRNVGEQIGGGGGFGNTVPVTDRANYRANARTAANTRAIMNSTNSLETKENCWDGIAFLAINAIIDMISDSLVQWINSGFEGSPGFVSDPGSFFLGVGNEVVGRFIDGTGLDFLCDPFLLPTIRLGLEYRYRAPFRLRARCTPLRIAANFERFANGNFYEGGWGSWVQMFSTGGNPYGAYLSASLEIDSRLASAMGLKQQELNWGRGFLSWRKCSEYVQDDDEGTNRRCAKYGNIETPGSVVETQINNGLDSGKRRIEVADEINEIFAALFNQLLKATVSGLSGAGDKSGSSVPDSWPSCSSPTVAVGKTCINSSGNLTIKSAGDSQCPNTGTAGTPGENVFIDNDGNCIDDREETFSFNPPDLPAGGGGVQSVNLAIMPETIATQDGILHMYAPGQAKDGEKSGTVNCQGGRCFGGSTTRKSTNPWWEIDLAQSGRNDFVIEKIVIYPVVSHEHVSVSSSYSETTLLVLDANRQQVGSRVTLPGSGFTNPFSYTPPALPSGSKTHGRYVRIERKLTDEGYLAISEVEVYGRAVTPENSDSVCKDNADNDNDGATDSADSDCAQFLIEEGGPDGAVPGLPGLPPVPTPQ